MPTKRSVAEWGGATFPAEVPPYDTSLGYNRNIFNKTTVANSKQLLVCKLNFCTLKNFLAVDVYKKPFSVHAGD